MDAQELAVQVTSCTAIRNHASRSPLNLRLPPFFHQSTRAFPNFSPAPNSKTERLFLHAKPSPRKPRLSIRRVCREILADGSIWYFSGLYPSGRAVAAPHQAKVDHSQKPSAQLHPEPAAPSRGASHHGTPYVGQSQHGMPLRNGTALSGAELNGDAEQLSGETPWRRVLPSADGNAYYWNKVSVISA